jgi:hypothetical protein
MLAWLATSSSPAPASCPVVSASMTASTRAFSVVT